MTWSDGGKLQLFRRYADFASFHVSMEQDYLYKGDEIALKYCIFAVKHNFGLTTQTHIMNVVITYMYNSCFYKHFTTKGHSVGM